MTDSQPLFNNPRHVGIVNQSAKKRCRSFYTNLIDTLVAVGEKDIAKECAQMAVRHGIWNDPLQRPELHYVPAAPAIPVHDQHKFWFTEFLEHHFCEIRREIDKVTDPSQWGIYPVEQSILGQGRWEQAVFYDQGVPFAKTHDLFPRTSALLETLRAKTPLPGLVSLLWLYPGSNVVPHCGHTNSRLRVHLGIHIPRDAGMRVGDQVLTWEEGKCIVFDDSFEHEVWNYSKTPRVILLFDIFNPDVPDPQKAEEDLNAQSFTERVSGFMSQSHLQRVTLRDNRIEVTLDHSTEKAIRRYLANSKVESVSYEDGQLRVERE